MVICNPKSELQKSTILHFFCCGISDAAFVALHKRERWFFSISSVASFWPVNNFNQEKGNICNDCVTLNVEVITFKCFLPPQGTKRIHTHIEGERIMDYIFIHVFPSFGNDFFACPQSLFSILYSTMVSFFCCSHVISCSIIT